MRSRGSLAHVMHWLAGLGAGLGVAALGLAVVLGGVVLVARRHRLPAPTGSFAVGTRLVFLNDPTRTPDGAPAQSAAGGRPIVVQLWYPAAASDAPLARYRRWKETTWRDAWQALVPTHSRWNAPLAATTQPLPVLLFSPRWGGTRTQNSIAIEELASHGYVVAAVDHPGNAERVELADGSVIAGSQALEGPGGPSSSAHDQIAWWNAQLGVWAADMRFALDDLARRNADSGDPLHARLGLDRVGAWGHSFGGAAALRLCGLDPRVISAVNLDGWTFAGLDHRTGAQTVLLVYEQVTAQREEELRRLPEPGSVEDQMDREDFRLTEASLQRFRGLRAFVEGTQHADFSDEPVLPPLRRGSWTGPIAPARSQEILRQLLLGWFGRNLPAEGAPPSGSMPAAPEIHLDRWPHGT